MAERKLTPKQQRFVEEYLKDLDPSAAYRRAGYKPKTDKAARNAASRLLANVGVSEAVAAAKQSRAERVQVTQDDVIRGLLKEAGYTGEGCSHSARVAAWAHLGKHLGMFVDKIAPVNPDGTTPYESSPSITDRIDRLTESLHRLAGRQGHGHPAANGHGKPLDSSASPGGTDRPSG